VNLSRATQPVCISHIVYPVSCSPPDVLLVFAYALVVWNSQPRDGSSGDPTRFLFQEKKEGRLGKDTIAVWSRRGVQEEQLEGLVWLLGCGMTKLSGSTRNYGRWSKCNLEVVI